MALTPTQIINRYGKERRFDESDESLLSRLLTVRFNESNLTTIGDLSLLKNLVKLYLRDNSISSLINLDSAPKLTHLYIINNEISELETVAKLPYLEKLYGGRNRIQVIEGLQNMTELVELHIESQKLYPGEKMHLEPQSLSSLKALEVLNISSNRIDNLEFCASLTKLKNLKCEDNRLNSIAELQYLKNCKKLSKVCFRGNPIAKEKRYRDSVILNVEAIESLDEKEVKKNEVAFIRNWNQFKIDKESKTNLLAEARSKRNQLGYSDLDTVFNGLPSGYGHLTELMRRREDTFPSQTLPSHSEPRLGSPDKPGFPLQSRSIGDTGSKPEPMRRSPARAATPEVTGGGGDVTPIPKSPKPTTPYKEPVKSLMIENSPKNADASCT